MAFLRVWHYLSRAKIQGDYLEFGVFEGASFKLSLKSAAKFFIKGSKESPRFFAFDSFEGLPELHASRDSNAFQKGEYKAGVDLFKKNIHGAAKGWDVRIVPGFFNHTLKESVRRQQDLKAASFVAVDCDIYESTLDVLRFVTPLLRNGSVLYFDDWYFSGGNMNLGEPGACADWLSSNPAIQLIDFGNVGIMGKLFIVNLLKGRKRRR